MPTAQRNTQIPKPKAKRRATSQASLAVHEHILKELRSEFESFLKQAPGEEMWFLFEVLNLRNSLYSTDPLEVGIASAFEYFITYRHEYIQLDRDDDLIEAVKDFISGYKETGGQLLPRSDGWYLWRRGRKRRIARPDLDSTPTEGQGA
jgi:hypothetical protein